MEKHSKMSKKSKIEKKEKEQRAKHEYDDDHHGDNIWWSDTISKFGYYKYNTGHDDDGKREKKKSKSLSYDGIYRHDNNDWIRKGGKETKHRDYYNDDGYRNTVVWVDKGGKRSKYKAGLFPWIISYSIHVCLPPGKRPHLEGPFVLRYNALSVFSHSEANSNITVIPTATTAAVATAVIQSLAKQAVNIITSHITADSKENTTAC